MSRDLWGHHLANQEPDEWYHASPQKLLPGAVLTPGGGGESNWNDFYQNHPDRADHVWLERDPERARYWARGIFEHNPSRRGQVYIYKVLPDQPPRTHESGEGWVVPKATVLEKHDNGWPFWG